MGYASSALSLLSNYLFDQLSQTHRLQLTIDVANIASCKGAEKCGYVKEGILRSSGFNPQSPEDCYVFSKVRNQEG